MRFSRHHDEWTWQDEEVVLRDMPLCVMDRYITSIVWRRRTFDGRPVTGEWLDQFRARAEHIKAFRQRVHA